MNTPPASPARPSHNAPHASHHQIRASSEPPRQQAERQGLKDRFAAKLEREEGGAPTQGRDSAAVNSSDGLASRSQLPLERDGSENNDSGLAQRDMQNLLTGPQATSAAGLSGAIPMDTAMLQRMAAQIAEGIPGAASSEASIQFPDGSLAESAQIRREPDGSIAIRIAGFDPRLSAFQSGRAEVELLTALALRRLKVSSILLERTKSDQRSRESSRESAISRVV